MSIHLEIIKEKTRILSGLQADVESCSKCAALCTTRNKTVFGYGDINAKLMLIGEGPGADEDLQGKPFVGRSGKLLTAILESHGFKREKVYIANIVKCRPPNNRVPEKEEVANCAGYLHKQIEVINPKIIACLGGSASMFFVGLPIGKARGKWFDYNGRKLICLFHPAFLLRNPAAKKDMRVDMEILSSAMRD
jgi:DNA polymerase